MEASVFFRLRYLTLAFAIAILCIVAGPSVRAQVLEPVIKIDKKIVTYVFNDAGLPIEEVEVNHLGEVLVGTPLFFRYTVRGTESFTDTYPSGVPVLTVKDDMGTLTKEDDIAFLRFTTPITATQPVTITNPISNTVVISSTTAFMPGAQFGVDSTAIISDTGAIFTPKSGRSYSNVAIAIVGLCLVDCDPDPEDPDVDEDDASYVGLYGANTPGYWKNHSGSWFITGYDPILSTLGDVFDLPTELQGLSDTTLGEALGFKGGKGRLGAARILMRSAVASLLNASFHEAMLGPGVPLKGPGGVVYFPYPPSELLGMINADLKGGNRTRMLMLARTLDDYNNGIDIMSIYDY